MFPGLLLESTHSQRKRHCDRLEVTPILRPATAASGPTWAPRDEKTPFCDAVAGGDDGFMGALKVQHIGRDGQVKRL